ncbi:hypothetical protein [Alteromonas ponticola]|uniref:GGDEF domain-containing protein n=1 Tax=Alteromonas ponticola TaxID=2720613 RepID=A0ABX1R388_9ALTE|nr:hypothetical protein [Alteromonas ponticola]NMH60905.1 hypothetical protein [Alteromonas ponticola]
MKKKSKKFDSMINLLEEPLTKVSSIFLMNNALHLLIIIFFFFCFYVNAGVVDNYEEERSRILRLNYYDVYDELTRTDVFDLNTALGKHFFNIITSVSHKSESTVPFTDEDFKILQKKFPKFALEYEILSVSTSNISAEKKINQLQSLSETAVNEGWKRLYLYAIGQIVRFEFEDRKAPSALIRLLSIVDEAPLYEAAEMAFDYPLQSVYLDLAFAFIIIGESKKAISYCEMAGDFLPKTSQFYHLVLRCKADALEMQNKQKEAFQLISQSIERARVDGEEIWLSTGLQYAANLAIALDQLSLAESYLIESMRIENENNYDGVDGNFYHYLKLAQINIRLKKSDMAKNFIERSIAESRGRHNNLAWSDSFLLVFSDMAKLEGEYQSAVDHLKLAIENTKKTNHAIPIDTLKDLTEKFNSLQIKNLNHKNSHQKNSIKITLILMIGILALLILLIIKTIIFKKSNNSFEELEIYDLNSILPSLDSALMNIRKRIRKKQSTSPILLLQFDTYNIEEFSENFMKIAKELRYQISNEDVIGQFSSNSILIFFEEMSFPDAEIKIKRLLSTLTPLRQDRGMKYRYTLGSLRNNESIRKRLSFCYDKISAMSFELHN